jgi:uncharacterized protein
LRTGDDAFPSAGEAVFLVIGLYLAEYLAGAALYDFRGILGLDVNELSALSLLLGNALAFTVAMHLAHLDYARLFHDGTSSIGATLLLLGPLVAALVPGLLVAIGLLIDVVEALAPLSRWEEAMFRRYSGGSLPVWVAVCILAPVLEEMLFRGLVLRSFLQRYPRWPAIAFSAILFGAAHLNIYQFVGAFFMGLALGWLYERTRSLLPCIALHGLYNGAVTWHAVRGEERLAGGWEAAVASLLVSALALFLLRRLLAPRPLRA